MNDTWFDVVAIIATTVAVIFGLLFAIVATQNHLSYPADYAAYEQLVASAENPNISCQNSEDLVGQIVDFNQGLAATKAYNRMPIIGLTIPDGWDNVESIEFPQDC